MIIFIIINSQLYNINKYLVLIYIKNEFFFKFKLKNKKKS